MFVFGRGKEAAVVEVVAGPIPPGRTVFARRGAALERGACGATFSVGGALRVMVYFADGGAREYSPRELLTEDDVLADALAGEVMS